MKKKIIGILVMTLLIATAVLPIVNSENKNIQHVYDDNKSGKASIISDDCGCIKNNVYNEIYTRFPVMEIKYKPLELIDSSPKPIAMEGLPEYFNWMDYEGQDWTTPAKNQVDPNECGCCWDFAAIGALESIINIREGNAELDMDLSEQYVLSCLPKSGSCRGGWSYSAFNYMKEYFIDGAYYNGSLSESCFPYVGIDVNGNNMTESGLEPVLCSEKCENWEEQLIPIKDCGSWIPDGSIEDREAIKTQIMQHGPVCTYFLVTWGFMGAFMEWGNESHNSTDYYPYKWANGINHVVVIVGWKDDPSINKGGYWIVKNSWGTDWGYDGFFNIEYKSLNIDGFQIDWVDYDSDKKNWPPNKPVVLGPEEGDMGEELIFSTSTTDPINREVYYLWDFGDEATSEWIGPYNSGEIVSISNTWSDKGLYNVKVKSKNSDEKESKWSDLLIVGIPKKNEAIDQNQNSCDTGYGCKNAGQFAQSFIPTEDTLSEIKLYMYKRGNPIKIMVIIRDDLYNMDLTSVEISAENIPERFSWITFDFPDIDVIPGETYYIVWNPIAFDYDNTFYWGFGDNDPYPNGCAWVGRHWKELEITGFNDPDFCFKTYHAKTKIKSFDTQIPWIFRLIQRFPILEYLLQPC